MTLQPVLTAEDASTLSLIQKQAGAKQEVALTPIALAIPLHLEDKFKLRHYPGLRWFAVSRGRPQHKAIGRTGVPACLLLGPGVRDAVNLSATGCRYRVRGLWIEPIGDDARPNRRESRPGPPRPPVSTGSASRLEHSLDPCVHFFFLDQFSALSLLDSFADSRAKAGVIFQEFQGGVLHQFFRIEAFTYRDPCESRFLLGSEMDFHAC